MPSSSNKIIVPAYPRNSSYALSLTLCHETNNYMIIMKRIIIPHDCEFVVLIGDKNRIWSNHYWASFTRSWRCQFYKHSLPVWAFYFWALKKLWILRCDLFIAAVSKSADYLNKMHGNLSLLTKNKMINESKRYHWNISLLSKYFYF